MSLISSEYLQQQRMLHARGDYGVMSIKWTTSIAQLAHMYQCRDILDYGCGTGQVKKAIGDIVREYDPCIPGKDLDPDPADMVVCTDVLEHIEPDKLDEVLAHLVSKVKKALFITIALYEAEKWLPDGRNAHLIVESADWWRERLSKHIQFTDWSVMKREVAGLAVLNKKALTGVRPSAKRRKLNKDQRKKFDWFFRNLQEGVNRYSDPLSRIETYDFWEGVDDQPADCIFVVDILEHQWDVKAALEAIKQVTRRAAMICIKPDFRRREYWEDVISHYFYVNEVVEDQGMISFVANAKTLVPGAKIIPAGTDESRWDNISSAIAKYPDIVQEAPAHGRRAIIGCYGPSLQQSWPVLLEQSKDPDSDVVSVSGSHDFLLSKGIVPRFHIECDPRPHKAQNIAVPNPDTEYLLSSTCHPKMFEKVAGSKIRLWHTSDGEVARRIVDELKSKAPLVFGGGSVGLRSLSVMYRMGYRKLSIFGMDCSFSDDGSIKWAGAHAQKENPKEFPLVRVAYNGRIFTTTWILLTYGTDFFDMMNRFLENDPSVEFRVYGDGLLQARVAGPPEPINVLPPEQEAA